jgi:hypothetical protein
MTKKSRRGDLLNRPPAHAVPMESNGGWLTSAHWHLMGIGGSESAAPWVSIPPVSGMIAWF